MLPTESLANGLMSIMGKIYNEAIMELPREDRPENMDIFFNEYNRAFTYAMFCAHGRNIFDINDDLLEMFRNTDVGDVPASSIRLPYDIFYLSFGQQRELKLSESWFVDGAYVYAQTIGDAVHLHIDVTTTRGNDPSSLKKNNFIIYPEQRYHLTFNIAQERAIEEVLYDALHAEVKEMKPNSSSEKEFEQAAIEAESMGIDLIDGKGRGAKRRAKALQDGFEVFRETVNLVVNTLFFLSAYPEENTLEWPNDAPVSLTQKANHGKTPKEKRRAESKLLPLGFSRIRFCRLPNRYKAGTVDGGHSNVKQHWRRGHWRHQPYGKGRQLKKLIWIMPVIVNRDSESEIPGHIYTVE